MTSPERPSRRRPQSAPPRSLSLEAAWRFHHKDISCSEGTHGPRLGCKSATESSYDKATASLACDLLKCTGGEGRPITKRCCGQFSPQAGEVAVAQSRISTIKDFHARGVLDIDRNLRRGAGLGPKKALDVLENGRQLSEEQESELKRSLASLAETDMYSEIPEFIHELGHIGIECRRLAAA